jgi:glycerol uptake facilitator-like aquaporin
MLALSLLVEFLGTAFFLSVILSTARFGAKQPILIGTALAIAILVGGGVSGGHFNPAVTAMFYSRGGIDAITCASYVVAQVLGGFVASIGNSGTK